jgi:hypothetical protein
MTTTAMTVAASNAAAITTPEAFTAALSTWEQQFNVLTPFTTFSALAPGWGISGTIVAINPDKAAGDVYDGLPFLKAHERAIAKKGLRKLAEGAGISTQTYELATTDRYHWKVKAIATYRGIDGAQLAREATKEWDLRDGSPQMRGWTPAQVLEARKHGLRNCEARAINAAIRECGCGIDQKYSVEQLRKPFIAIRVSFQPDYSDPSIKRLVTQHALGATSALYGGSATALAAPRPLPDEDDAPTEPRLVGASAAAASTPGTIPSAATSTGAAAPNPDGPPTPDAVRIAEAKPVPGTSKKTGRPYTKYEITDSRGETHSTFDKGIYEAAVTARDSRAWVEIAIEVANGFKNMVEISPAGQSPKLPMDGGY